uniref:Uncharacterized protein n=1 Tax=Cacopsylla melanoneura TaxID=428564 RepID=A0A8D8WSS5_9HEMI
MQMFSLLCQYGHVRSEIKERMIKEMKKNPTKNLLYDKNFPKVILDLVMEEGIWGGMDIFKSEMVKYVKKFFHNGTLLSNETIQEIIGKTLDIMREKAEYETEMAIEELKGEQKLLTNGNTTTISPDEDDSDSATLQPFESF